MTDSQTPAPGTPTQVAHPGKAALRTMVQVAIPTLLFLLLVLPLVIEAVLAEPSLPDNLRAWLLGVSAAITAVAGIVARIMAIPALQPLLARLGIGTGVERERGAHAARD